MSVRDYCRSVLAACNISFFKTINYIEVRKYRFAITGLINKMNKEFNDKREIVWKVKKLTGIINIVDINASKLAGKARV